jgi:hypothetical protein
MVVHSIYKPSTFLEECLDFQAAIDKTTNPEIKDSLGKEFCALLFGRANYLGSKQVIIKSAVALVALATGRVNETNAQSGFIPSPALQFDEVVAKGRLGNPEYTRFKEQGVLTWPIFDAHVLNVAETSPDELMDEIGENQDFLVNRMPTDRPLRRPIHMPVALIEQVYCGSEDEPYTHSERIASSSHFEHFADVLLRAA